MCQAPAEDGGKEVRPVYLYPGESSDPADRHARQTEGGQGSGASREGTTCSVHREKEPTQKGGVRSEPAWQASVQEAGETGCKGRRPAASLYSEGLQKKKKSPVYKRRQSRTVSGWQGWGAGSCSGELQVGLYSPVTRPVGEPECKGCLPTPGNL